MMACVRREMPEAAPTNASQAWKRPDQVTGSLGRPRRRFGPTGERTIAALAKPPGCTRTKAGWLEAMLESPGIPRAVVPSANPTRPARGRVPALEPVGSRRSAGKCQSNRLEPPTGRSVGRLPMYGPSPLASVDLRPKPDPARSRPHADELNRPIRDNAGRWVHIRSTGWASLHRRNQGTTQEIRTGHRSLPGRARGWTGSVPSPRGSD